MKHSTTALVLAAGMALAAPRAALAIGDGADSLPISQITLYRSGVGSFVRQGVVEGDAQASLRFRTEQINDILKSMVVLDLDGGTVGGVTYASKEPLERRLRAFAVDISDDPSRAELLTRLRGAQVLIRTTEGEERGAVLGVEARNIVHPQTNRSTVEHSLNLLTVQGVRTVQLDSVRSFQVLDAALAEELNKALAALAEHRADTTKSVAIDFTGRGSRRVVIAYVQETPVWKTSYRLVLPEEGGGDAVTRIQGWAIVENTTDEDWQNVRLALVAGQPVSFQMDLYEPLFLERPEVPVPVAAGVTPRTYAGGQSPFRDAQEEGALEARGRMSARLAMPGTPPPADKAEGFSSGFELMRAGVAAARATAAQEGEVFQYVLDAPVTVARQQSAMLPILSALIDTRRVSIFNRNDGLSNPMRGVEITNTSDLQLMPGPIAVYDGSAYAGDAQIGHVPAGDKRLLAYAVDLDVDATTTDRGAMAVRKIRIVDGLIEQTTQQQHTVEYAFENKDREQGRTIIVEHPRIEGWDLVETPEPKERTQDTLRFEVTAKANDAAKLAVTQQVVQSQRLELLSYDLPTLLAHQQAGRASAKVVEAFREAARRQALVQDAERTIARLQNERNEINTDQQRVRQNMQTVDRQSDLYTRYVKRLSDQETRLEQIGAEITQATNERERLRAELAAYLRSLNVE
ncbi:MAG TPA: hypothetical protein PLU35_08460 [Phycisphaerales bacterium]|nr:hypothetical protein [Phycisphaerales bacterium]